MENTVTPFSLVGAIRSTFGRLALTLKLAGIFILVLLLQIPLLMVDGLLRERQHRRDNAITEITSTWGRSQVLVGPILVVPYRIPHTVEKQTLVNGTYVRTTEEKYREAYAYFLPEKLEIEGDLDPSKRYRGIYDATVYTSRLKLSGRFIPPDLKALDLLPDQMAWDRAWLCLSLSDMRGTRETVSLRWGTENLPMAPGTLVKGFESGLHARPSLANFEKEPVSFSLNLALNGSDSITIAPTGAFTKVSLNSSWSDPSFTGAFLPSSRSISPAGFSATWETSYYGRDFPQQFTSLSEQPNFGGINLNSSNFGVALVTPVDSYRAVERAIKHGILFIAMLFTVFFLFEVLAALKLHTLHYLLVGAALCLFYLALLSLSEFVAFHYAYLTAAAASTLLIGLYCRSILRSGFRSLVISGALTGVYGFLFFVLQMQDYALLAGTAALFTVLAVVMYTTRKVDWTAQANARASA